MKFYPHKDNPTQVKILAQLIDTLVTSHISLDLDKFGKVFTRLKDQLDTLKNDAQEIVSFSQDQRFVTSNIGKFGKFRIYARGIGAYKFIIQNEDLLIFISDHKFGSNDFNDAQIRIEYRAKYLFEVGHEKAYKLALEFVNYYLGETKNKCQRIDLATDIQGIKYDFLDNLSFQTNYKKTTFQECKEYYFKEDQNFLAEETFFKNYIRNNKVTGFHIGGGDFLFRIYDKLEEIKKRSEKSFVTHKWILNGYKKTEELPVWRHEVQYRGSELRKFMPKNIKDEVLYHFNQLDKLWNNATNKVRWTELSDEELIKIGKGKLKSGSVRQIFNRARQNPERIDFWNILQYWNNELSSQIVKYDKLKEPNTKIPERFIKAFISSTYKTYGNNPANLPEVLTQVEQNLKKAKNISLQEFGEINTMSSFVENAKMVDKYGYSFQMNYQKIAFEYFNLLIKKLQNIDSHPEMKKAKDYFIHKGMVEEDKTWQN